MLKFKSIKELKKESQQLASDYPNRVDFLVYGTSIKGNDLYCLKIGKGKINVLTLGFPHSNEPLGGTFSVYYAKKLVKDRSKLEKFTFWIVPCADPDGALLNEKWFTKDYSSINEVIYNYRNKANNQIAWTFPIKIEKKNKIVYEYKNPPTKTKALIKLIDKIRPNFLFSLHNAEFGGVYHYISCPVPKLYPKLKNAVIGNKLPLHLGTEEMPYIKRLASSIFLDFGLKDEFNLRPQMIKKMKYGTSPADYCKNKYQTFSVITEIPLFWTREIFNKNLTSKKYSETVSVLAGFNFQIVKFIKKELKNIKDIFWQKYIKYWAEVIEEDSKDLLKTIKEKEHILSEAELFDLTCCKKWSVLKFVGPFLRVAKLEKKKSLERRCRKFISSLMNEILKGKKIKFTTLRNALNLQEEIIDLVLSNC